MFSIGMHTARDPVGATTLLEAFWTPEERGYACSRTDIIFERLDFCDQCLA